MGSLTFKAIGWALLVDVGIAILAFTGFNVLRMLSFTRTYYEAKRHLNIPFRYRPPKLSRDPFTWWLRVLWINQEDFLACAGQDALTYVRILALGLRMSFYVGLVVLGVVLPVNWAAGTAITCNGTTNCRTANTLNLADFDYTTLANIPNKSNLLWVHVGAVYIISAIVMRMLWVESKQAVALRVKYLASTPKGGETHTILVSNIPGVKYGTITHRIGDYADSPITCCIPRSVKDKARQGIGSSAGAVRGGADRLGQQLMAVPGGKFLHKAGFPPERLDVYTTPDAPFDVEQYGKTSAGVKTELALPAPPSNALDRADAEMSRPRVHITQKYLDLGNRDHREQPVTDFDTWRQAEAALRSGMSVEELVRREFARTYSAQDIEAVTVVKDSEHLRGLAAQYDKTRTKLQDLIELWNSKLIAGKQVKVKKVPVVPMKEGQDAMTKWGNTPVRIEKSEYLEWTLNRLRQQVEEAQADASRQDTGSAFVTFRTRMVQTQAAGSLHYHNQAYWTTEPAMEPHAIEWGNTGLRGWELSLRILLAWTIFLLITAFYTIPVTALQGLLQINHWKSIPGMTTILANSFLNGLITGIIPGLALKIFMAILPTLIKWINRLQGIHSSALIDFEVGRKFYGFLYLQVFLIFIIGGSLITNAKNLANSPSQFVKSLGQVIPSSANFYITYTLVQALISTPVSIINAVGVILFVVRSRVVASDSAKRRLWAYQSFSYGPAVPNITLTFLFLLTFGVMTPFMSIACFIFFVTALIVARYQLLYQYREQYQSGGRFWQIVFDQMITALFTFQIVMFAVLSVKQFAYSPFLLVPIISTGLFLAMCRHRFDRPLNHLSAHAAADLDRADANNAMMSPDEEQVMLQYMDCENTSIGPASELYANPAFTVTNGHDDVLRDLSAARRRVEARRSGAPEPVEISSSAESGGKSRPLGNAGDPDQDVLQNPAEAADIANAV